MTAMEMYVMLFFRLGPIYEVVLVSADEVLQLASFCIAPFVELASVEQVVSPQSIL
jgi:hypothetical protein